MRPSGCPVPPQTRVGPAAGRERGGIVCVGFEDGIVHLRGARPGCADLRVTQKAASGNLLKHDILEFLEVHAIQKIFEKASMLAARVCAWEGKTWLKRNGIETRCAVACGAG